MKNIKGIKLLCILGLLCIANAVTVSAQMNELTPSNHCDQITTSATIDTLYWEKFKHIAAQLKSGNQLSSAYWDAFEQDLRSDNLHHSSLRESYLLAFDPARLDEQKQLIGFQKIIIEHLIAMDRNSDQVDSFIASIHHKALWSRTIELATQWLVPEIRCQLTPPDIRFIGFGPDGYADRGAVIIDPYLAFRLGTDGFTKLIAHEFHHVFTRAFFPRPPVPTGSPLYAIFHTLNQLQIEGIADMIDKGQVPIVAPIELMQPLFARFNQAYQRTPQTLLAFDRLLQEWPVDEQHQLQQLHSEQLRNLFELGGHPDGYYMANLINNKLGKDILIHTISNPFEFIRAFQQAAILSPDVAPLSPSSIRRLEEIENTIYQLNQ